jgi:hypothetical protein
MPNQANLIALVLGILATVAAIATFLPLDGAITVVWNMLTQVKLSAGCETIFNQIFPIWVSIYLVLYTMTSQHL